MTRSFFMVLLAATTMSAACTKLVNKQCEQNSNCDLSSGGVCMASATGGQWCAYPDPACPSGFRYSTQAVGDGVSGSCVADQGLDAGVDGPAVEPPNAATSCVSLPHTCGITGNDDCCNSLSVSGGTYYRSYDASADGLLGDMRFPATISGFYLDKYEVTVGRFRAFVKAGMGTQTSPPMPDTGAHMKINRSGWDAGWNASLAADETALTAALKCDGSFHTWTDTAGSNENRPINCITWFEAMAFCAWDGGFLATEAEWNYAATGGSQQRVYPWSMPPGAMTPLDSLHASFSCDGDGNPNCALTDIGAVGTKSAGDGRWGQSDLSGNVNEWTLDWYANYTNTSQCTDCAYIVGDTVRTYRGGGYGSNADDVRGGWRNFGPPGDRHSYTGVRCARAAAAVSSILATEVHRE